MGGRGVEQWSGAARFAVRLERRLAAGIVLRGRAFVKNIFRPRFWIDLEEGVAYLTKTLLQKSHAVGMGKSWAP